MEIRIESIGTANPPLRLTQEEVYQYLHRYYNMSKREGRLYYKLLLNSSIMGRFISMDSPAEILETDQDKLVNRFLKYARMIAVEAIQKCLRESEIKPDDVNCLVVNTCTGYICPGLTSYIVEELNLNPHIKLFDIMGMGCGAMIPNMEMAYNYLKVNPECYVLSVAVEICSATFFMGEDEGLVVSNSIFGDGAAAVLLSNNGKGILNFIDFEALISPEYREELRYRTENHRLRNVLSPQVPAIGAKMCQIVAQRILEKHNLKKEDIRYWGVHPGGTTVLDHVCNKLELAKEQLKHSYYIFKQYGNMSSPSIIFVLNEIIKNEELKKGDRLLLLSFGAGFSAFGVLLEVK